MVNLWILTSWLLKLSLSWLLWGCNPTYSLHRFTWILTYVVYKQGSDTTSNSSCAILFYLARNQEKQKKLQAELDGVFKDRGISGVMEYEDIKALPYLQASIDEALRMHSTSSMGLPRLMTECDFKGEHISSGMECSVPAYTVHVSRSNRPTFIHI